jgi:predicted RecA/RadA family phage recombinase
MLDGLASTRQAYGLKLGDTVAPIAEREISSGSFVVESAILCLQVMEASDGTDGTYRTYRICSPNGGFDCK